MNPEYIKAKLEELKQRNLGKILSKDHIEKIRMKLKGK